MQTLCFLLSFSRHLKMLKKKKTKEQKQKQVYKFFLRKINHSKAGYTGPICTQAITKPPWVSGHPKGDLQLDQETSMVLPT